MKDEILTHKETMARLARIERASEENLRSIKEINKSIDKLAKRDEETRKKLEGMGVSNGMVAEDLIFEKFEKKKVFAGIAFDEVEERVWKIGKDSDGKNVVGEYDVLLFNGTAAAIIDVKYRARKKDINYLINTQLPKFRTLFPKYKDCKIYLGLGGMSFEDGVKAAAIKKGIGVIRMSDEIVKVDDKNVVAW